jgi:hypothetical protein
MGGIRAPRDTRREHFAEATRSRYPDGRRKRSGAVVVLQQQDCGTRTGTTFGNKDPSTPHVVSLGEQLQELPHLRDVALLQCRQRNVHSTSLIIYMNLSSEGFGVTCRQYSVPENADGMLAATSMLGFSARL